MKQVSIPEANLVDRLNEVRNKIADLKVVEVDLENKIKANGDGVYNGTDCYARVTTVTTKNVNWAAIAKKLNPSVQLLAGNTSYGDAVRLTIHPYNPNKAIARQGA